MALTERQIKDAMQPVVYVQKDAGEIVAVYRNRQRFPLDAVYESDAAVQAFLGRSVSPAPTTEQKLAMAGLTIDALKEALGLE